MKYLMILAALLAACDDDKVEGAVHDECKALLKHIVEISPQGKGVDAEALVADLPIEDYQGCAATEPEIRACMAKASDVAGIRKCAPSEAITGCVRKVKVAKEKAKGDDGKFAELRARCWAGDTKAADGLKVD